jgi:hypothetical protein
MSDSCECCVLSDRGPCDWPIPHSEESFFFEWPRSRCYGRTAALRLIVQPCVENDHFVGRFPCNRAPVE